MHILTCFSKLRHVWVSYIYFLVCVRKHKSNLSTNICTTVGKKTQWYVEKCEHLSETTFSPYFYDGVVCFLLPKSVFFYQHCFTIIIDTYCCDENMINTIGKIIHTLVKENTPRRHKIRWECGFTQKFTFFYRSLCFLPYCNSCVNIGREVKLIIRNTYHKIFDTHTCLNF